MRNSILSFVAIVIVIIVSSCHKPNSDPSVLSVAVNDSIVSSSSANGGLVITADSFFNYSRNVLHAVPIKQMLIQANGTPNFALQILDWRDSTLGNGIRTGTYYFNYAQCPYNSDTSCYTHASAYLGTKTYDAFQYFSSLSGLSSASTGSVIITACDEVNHKITGTFSGVLIAGPGDTLKMSNGVFTNVNYTVHRF